MRAATSGGGSRMSALPHRGSCSSGTLRLIRRSFGLKFNKSYPFTPHYVTPCCGRGHRELAEAAVYRTGRWQATAPGAGKNSRPIILTSSRRLSAWDAIAEQFVEAGDDPAKLKTFWNLTLGLPFDVAGEAPDHELLMARREDYPAELIPPGALLLTAFADVQMRGIYVEVVAWAADQQSWTIFADISTARQRTPTPARSPSSPKVYLREWPDTYGERPLDEPSIDSGYRTDVVYEWTRRHRAPRRQKVLTVGVEVPLGIATDQESTIAAQDQRRRQNPPDGDLAVKSKFTPTRH